MKRILQIALILVVGITGTINSQEYKGFFRTPLGNDKYHQFIRNHDVGAAVYINQLSNLGPILRLSSGTESANTNVKLTVENNGNVGVGVANPIREIHIGTGDNSGILLQGGTNVGNTCELLFKASHSNFEDAYIKAGIFFERKASYALGDLHFAVNGSANSGNVGISDSKMTISRSGNIGIGTTTPNNKLDVNGTIRSKEVKVETNWSDFVFYDNYKLKTLEQVETFIKANGHLPDVPSEKEVKENGLNLGESDAVLLQKIEELTLYVIEQNKKTKEQSIKIKEQNKKIKVLEEKETEIANQKNEIESLKELVRVQMEAIEKLSTKVEEMEN